jgi:ATP-dependent protease ClpP protease subunit
VTRASSIASVIALASDYVVLDESGSYLLHGPSGGTDAQRGAVSRRMSGIYRDRADLSDGDVGWRFEIGSTLHALRACEDGLADEVGSLARAEMVAEEAAAGGALPWSRRRAVLSSRCH